MSTYWEKRIELDHLKHKVAILSKELKLHEQETLRAKLKTLPPQQARVLSALVGDCGWHEYLYYSYYKTIQGATGLTRSQVSRALKALLRLGFVSFSRGLMTEDGEAAGSGYRITQAGHDWYWEHNK